MIRGGPVPGPRPGAPGGRDSVLGRCAGGGHPGGPGLRALGLGHAGRPVPHERGDAGGQYLKPLAASHAHAAPDAQFRHGDALRAATLAAGAEKARAVATPVLEDVYAKVGFLPPLR